MRGYSCLLVTLISSSGFFAWDAVEMAVTVATGTGRVAVATGRFLAVDVLWNIVLVLWSIVNWLRETIVAVLRQIVGGIVGGGYF